MTIARLMAVFFHCWFPKSLDILRVNRAVLRTWRIGKFSALMISLAIRLAAIGRAVGRRAFQLYCYKEKYVKREIGTLPILSFACTPLYKYIFGKSADSLERSNERSGECTILYLCNVSSIFSHDRR